MLKVIFKNPNKNSIKKGGSGVEDNKYSIIGMAEVEIKSNGTIASIFIDGHEIIHDRRVAQVPVLKLTVQCNLDIKTGLMPELPEPWSLLEAYRDAFKNYKGEKENGK